MNDSATVFIVDDDASVRRGLKRLMKSAGYDVEDFASAYDFLTFDRKCETPSCVVLDIKMPGMNGFDLQENLKCCKSPIPIIFISGHGNIPASVKAMKNGAIDFLPKPFDDEDLLAAVRSALADSADNWAAARQREKIMQRFETLTAREHEIMTYVISGMLNKQIAYALDISEKTVKVHRARVYEKLGVDSVAKLVRLTEQVGIKPATKIH